MTPEPDPLPPAEGEPAATPARTRPTRPTRPTPRRAVLAASGRPVLPAKAAAGGPVTDAADAPPVVTGAAVGPPVVPKPVLTVPPVAGPAVAGPVSRPARVPWLRPTVLPSCGVVGVAGVVVGGLASAQPPDAALRQLGPLWPAACLGLGVLLLATTLALSLSLRGPPPP